jgi:hypothetical protein
MEKREKIMLGAVAATALVAAAVFLSGQGGGGTPAVPAAQQVNADELARTVQQSALTKEHAYRISLLAQNATENPFYGGKLGLSQDDASGEGEELVYSGYIKVGQKIFAVINGIEYARGDQLAEGGYTVQSIERDGVVLERTDGSSGRKFTRRVPLVEDDSDKIRIRVVKKR